MGNPGTMEVINALFKDKHHSHHKYSFRTIRDFTNIRMAKKTRKAPTYRLAGQTEIPSLGLGMGSCDKQSHPKDTVQAVKDAIDLNYRHFDCCAWNEEHVGQGIHDKIKEGVISRSEVFVVSKLRSSYRKPELVEVGCRQSLNNLNLDYIDLYTLEYPADAQGIQTELEVCELWKSFEELVFMGLVKNIGVSGFNSEQLTRILNKCTIPPSVNQIEIHPYCSNRNLVEFCMEQGIKVTACSPLQNPEKIPNDKPTLLCDPILAEIAQRYNRSVAQVVIRWVLQRGLIVIPKSVKKDHIEENFNVFNFHLSQEDMDMIYSLNRNQTLKTLMDNGSHHASNVSSNSEF